MPQLLISGGCLEVPPPEVYLDWGVIEVDRPMEPIGSGQALVFIGSIKRLIVETDLHVRGRSGFGVLNEGGRLNTHSVIDPPQQGEPTAIDLTFIDVLPVLQRIEEVSGVLAFECADADCEVVTHRDVDHAPCAVAVAAVLR